MKTKEMIRVMKEAGHPMFRLIGYDHCCVGVIRRFPGGDVFCYSKKKIIKDLIKHGMSEEQAKVTFSFNQVGAFFGDKTPLFLIEEEKG